MLLVALLLQVQAADSVYASAALRDFVTRAAIENRVPPPSLAGYLASVESELALILRDSLGREIVGQLEQIAARAEWDRGGRYDLHVVGYRSQSAGAPYSALTFTRTYTVPTLYGSRLVLGINDNAPATRRDSTLIRRRAVRDTAAGRERLRAVHPLAVDRERYYRFTGGDTVANVHTQTRTIPLVRVRVEPVLRPTSNFFAFAGELDFDADRHQLVRMRGRMLQVTTEKDNWVVRGTGSVAVAYVEFENAEVNGRYWLPAFQRTEFQAHMGLLGDIRPVLRLVSRFRNYRTRDTTLLAEVDSELPRTRATLTYAAKDSVSRFGSWQQSLGSASASVTSDDFDDLAPDLWKPKGRPYVEYWPRRLEDVARYNRVEGMFTGVASAVSFRDAMPGLRAAGSVGWAWTEQTVRGTASLSLARGGWIYGSRVERALQTTNDFLLPLESGLSIGPLLSSVDNQDYVDRRIAALNVTRVIGNVDRGLITGEAAYIEDRPELRRVANAPITGKDFLFNRNAWPGRYARGTLALELHPRVSRESLGAGFGARILYEIAAGELDWQRVEARLALRKYWHGFVLGSTIDGGTVFGSTPPPQTMYELGGYETLPSYDYKEFGGDRAALGTGLVAYHFPIWRTPRRVKFFVLPGLSPGVGTGIQGGWTEASSAGARAALLALGGDGVTPLSRPTGRIRATVDLRVTILSGAIGGGIARPIDQSGRWRPFFVWGAAF